MPVSAEGHQEATALSEEPVKVRAFEAVLKAFVGDQVTRYHYDAAFHARRYRQAQEAVAALSDAGLLVAEDPIGPKTAGRG